MRASTSLCGSGAQALLRKHARIVRHGLVMWTCWTELLAIGQLVVLRECRQCGPLHESVIRVESPVH
jgi:hypothetical protein